MSQPLLKDSRPNSFDGERSDEDRDFEKGQYTERVGSGHIATMSFLTHSDLTLSGLLS